jgi:predicted DNA-binding ribbon-helix-helix protein
MTRLKQVKFYLGEEQYEKLREIAEKQGLSVPALVKSIVLEYLGEAEYGDLVSRIKELERKYEQLAREVGRIEKDLALLVKRCSKS